MNRLSMQSEEYNQKIIDMYSSVLKRRELGFIDKEEVFITNGLAIIVQHALENVGLFNDKQYNNIIYILNNILNGRSI